MTSTQLKKSLALACALLSPCSAGVFNEAQRNGPQRIAPGSIILINSGVPVATAMPYIAESFPLSTNVAGTSVRVIIDGVTINAYVLAKESEWVRALVPSHTPLGSGRLIVTYNGRESPAEQIHIAERGFAIFDGTYESYLGPSFRFPRALQNVSLTGGTRLNSLVDAARPGEFVSLWGTGLGAAPGNEAAGPIPAALSIPALAVFVGGKTARIVYAGRSGCCAGMDQIIFEVPSGIEGCNVPVWVRYTEEGHGSNAVYLSIKEGGGGCSDPHGLSASESRAIAAGNLGAARIHAMAGMDGVEWRIDFGAALNGRRIPLGTCVQAGGWDLGIFAMNFLSPWDAGGAIRVTNERTTIYANKQGGNTYIGRFSGRLEAGEYALENGSGGTNVGPFRTIVSVPVQPSFSWTNRDTLKSASMAEGITLTWTGGDDRGFVTITGEFDAGGEMWGNGGFQCLEQASKGSLTVPPELIARLASDWLDRPTYPGANTVRLSVGYANSTRLEIPGFGVGELQIGQRVDMRSIATVVLHP